MYPNINLMRLCRESNNNNNEKFKDVLSELEKFQNSHPRMASHEKKQSTIKLINLLMISVIILYPFKRRSRLL